RYYSMGLVRSDARLSNFAEVNLIPVTARHNCCCTEHVRTSPTSCLNIQNCGALHMPQLGGSNRVETVTCEIRPPIFHFYEIKRALLCSHDINLSNLRLPVSRNYLVVSPHQFFRDRLFGLIAGFSGIHSKA